LLLPGPFPYSCSFRSLGLNCKSQVILVNGAVGRIPNRCIHKADCQVSGLCGPKDCRLAYCRSCKQCNMVCPDFEEEHCPRLLQPPYVCNACERSSRCVLRKSVYRASSAHNTYRANLSSCREGLSYSAEELQWLDQILVPLVKKQQSIHHICATQVDKLLCSERTIYNLINQSALTVRNIDLPRKVRFRPRKPNKPFKVDKNCRLGRTYQDFQNYIQEYPDTAIVQIDSVEGVKGGKVFLTIFFVQSDLLLIYLRDRNTSQSVIDVFNNLEQTLGRRSFQRLFPLLLADNGSEFSNPRAIEGDIPGQLRTRLFYCNPSAPYQKAAIERSHEFIRMVLPKGSSFDALTQQDVSELTCHINSLIRKKLNDVSPLTAFSFFHGAEILQQLGLSAIPPDQVNLSPALIQAAKKVILHENL
jgi:transposase, IS30 family